MANPISDVWFSQAYYDPTKPTPIYVTWTLTQQLQTNNFQLQICESPDAITWSDWHWEPGNTGDMKECLGIQNGAYIFQALPAGETQYIKCRIRAGTTYEWVETGNCLRWLSNTLPSEWAMRESTVAAGEALVVDITKTHQPDWVASGIGYTHKMIVTFGTRTISADMIEYQSSVSLAMPLALLAEMPEDISREGDVTLETYREGSLVGSSAQTFTLTCPEDVTPSLTATTSLALTVGDTTYPDVLGSYVQNKSAVRAEITSASGKYGSYVVSYHIRVADRSSDGYNSDDTAFTSDVLLDSGYVSVRFTVTDSRGRTATETKTIYVMPYSPPKATLKVWRVDASGNVDVRGLYGKYEYDYEFSDLGGVNTCTAKLTVAGQTANNAPKSGDILPGNRMNFADSTTYSVVLTLTDVYGPELFAAVLPSHTSTTVVIRPTKYEKRRMVFGEYDTALDGLWTLTGWSLPEPEYQSNFVSIPGRHGALDLSAVLTDGEPTYGNRVLTATFESSEGDRLTRAERISDMVNSLDGHRMSIVLPDDQTRCLEGRVTVRTEYNDPAHASVTVTAECDPWRYNISETSRAFELMGKTQQAMLVNHGRRIAVPTVTVLGEKATISCRGRTWELYDGEYLLPDLALPKGKTMLTYSGKGTLVITYREAVL